LILQRRVWRRLLLKCGEFHIQVSNDRSTINLVDISDPANFQIGTAIHQ
jgi:hypothetical protein